MTKKSATDKLRRTEWPRIRDLRPTGRDLFVVDARPHGKKEYFALLRDAKTRAEQLALERDNKGVEAIGFPTEARVMARECMDRLAPFGKTLRDATDHYTAFLERERLRVESRTVEAAVAAYLEAREADVTRGDFAAGSLREARNRLKGFVAANGAQPVGSMTTEAIVTYLDSMRIGARTWLNVKLRLSTFFAFCKKKHWIEHNPCADAKTKVRRSEVHVFTVAETKDLLRALEGSPHREALLPYALVSLFAGLRPDEARQLDWSQVNFKTKSIHVLAHTSKTRESRFVPMTKTLITWLRPFAQDAGLIIGVNHRKRWQAVTWKATHYGREWPVDVMRHSFGSYSLAVHPNRAELAEVMGNSAKVIGQHYRRPILKAEAKRYWALKPQPK